VDTLVAGGQASEHDAKIAGKLANVLCGGAGGASREVTEDEVLELEREAFVSLCGEEKSQARMQAILTTNKPLRSEVMTMEDMLIVEAVRSAVGRAHKGALSLKRPDELAGEVIAGLLSRVPQVKPSDIEDLI